ncbi:MAG TPA: dioxygenase [Actinomycetospora sp.]|jgi:catechol 1,2-dioxygenase|uniref:dioxygenase family protein n=1 Tax=Actinomycetospora sp. TaxID=1872135 RepID=UPI002F3ED016
MDFSEDDSVDAVTASFADTPDPRLREVMDSLVRHLHGFLREVRPSLAEWERGIEFLTAIGQKCDEHRQEFILFSDVLGASMLVETMEAARQSGGASGATGEESDATASTVLGPFHVVRSPERALGDSIDSVGTGEPCLIEGSVSTPDGTPVPGARIDVWQADDHGFYDVQVPDAQPLGNGRGLFTADDEGRFWFRSIVPAHYPIPTDGPVGALLTATKRHPYRPAHVHFIVEAPGHVPVTTHVFVAGSAYLDSDAVFAVKQSLVRDFAPVDDPDAAARHGLPTPFRRARFDVVLQPASS